MVYENPPPKPGGPGLQKKINQIVIASNRNSRPEISKKKFKIPGKSGVYKNIFEEYIKLNVDVLFSDVDDYRRRTPVI